MGIENVEAKRLAALWRYQILDTLPETAFDDLVALASDLCDTPFAFINLIDDDRAWIKAAVGSDLQECERCIAFCDSAIRGDEIFEIPDTLLDERFKNNPFVTEAPHARFYAGAPLIAPDGSRIGAICVLDTEPRKLTEGQKRSLTRLARQVIQLLEARLQSKAQRVTNDVVELLNAVSVAANESDSSAKSITTAIFEVMRFTQASAGHFLKLDRKGKLQSSKLWSFENAETSESVRALSERPDFDSQGILAHKCLRSRKAETSIDLEGDSRNSELQKWGLIASLAFPVILKSEIVGVFEFFAKKDFEIDLNLERVISHVATQIGRSIERAELDSQLEKNREFLDAVLENLADGIVACNDAGELTLFNRATREFHGLDHSMDIPPDRWSEYYNLFKGDGETPFSLEEVPLFRALNGEIVKDAEMVIAPVNGKKRQILASGRALVGKDGRKLGAVCAMHDVTETKVAMARFDAATKNIQSLIDTCPVGISVLDKESNVVLWNPYCEKIYGWTKEEVLGHPLPFEEENQREEVGLMIQAVKLARQKVSLQVNRRRKDGRSVAVQVSLVPIIGMTGEIDGIMSVVVDISDMKQKEKDLVETNKALRAATIAKSEFLANMSHEIRTPLNGVIGMTELILDQGIAPEQRKYIEVIQNSAENLVKIISDILDFSKIEAGKLDIETIPFDLDFVLDDVHRSLEQAATAKGIRLNRSVSGDVNSKFLGDPGRIRQILVNLINNAIKFTSSGNVSTFVRLEKQGTGKTRVRFEVRDTGVGISPEALQRLFQAFSQADTSTTRRYGGTGLGLSISKRLVELMDGEIGVTSEIGKGSCFWFTLDLKANFETVPTPTKRANGLPRTPVSNVPIRILLAEDNPINRLIAVEMLARLGLSADTAENGKEVLALLASSHYDLVLMDCQMPELDGYEATKQIRANVQSRNCGVTIIALTANAMNGDREECLAVGMNDYLSKPMKLDELEAVIRRNIKSPAIAAS